MRRPRLLDLYCGAGGASAGYWQAGFDVVGVDLAPQPGYPWAFHRADARDVLSQQWFLSGFDAIHASPPCQAFTLAQRIQGNDHPDLVAPTRDLLDAAGLPYVIENVRGAPLRDPAELCGCMFDGLGVYRERWFETNWHYVAPPHREHSEPITKMGRPPVDGHRMHVVGNFAGVAQARQAMRIGWMVRDELREAIPPEYTAHVGAALARLLRSRT